jgi:hypothetical protein
MKWCLPCIVFVCLQAMPQNPQLVASKIDLPGEGIVLGVGMDEQRDLFVVQQLVLSTTEDRMVILSARRLSVWGLKTKSILATKMLDPNPRRHGSFPCGRVETSVRIHRVLLCSSESYLDLIDPDTLEPVGKIAVRAGQYIYDFLVDDVRGQVAVLATEKGSIRLATYSLLDGAQRQELILPAVPDPGMRLVIIPQTGQLVAAIDLQIRGTGKSDVYLCNSEPALDCTKVARIDSVSQMSLLGNELLVAINAFPDSKRDCLISVDLKTHSVARKYCSPKTGVHNAVGVVDHGYVAAFTGIGKRIWWKEENVLVENSFSLWRAEDYKIVAVAKDPTDFGGVQSVIRIFPSQTRPLFVAYIGESNVLYLFSIGDDSQRPGLGRGNSLPEATRP